MGTFTNDSWASVTAEIANFLERHPGEVVVVSLSKDFEHRGSLTQPSPLGSHSRFIDFYDFLFEQSRLKDHCAPRPSNPSKATLQEIVDKGKRCIIVPQNFPVTDELSAKRPALA